MNTKKSNWTEAKAIIAAWESAGSSTARAPISVPLVVDVAPPTSAPVAAADSRITIDDAIRARKHKTFAKQIRALADSRGYLMLDQFTARDIDTFYAN